MDIFKSVLEFLTKNLGFRGISLLIICFGAIYIWYQHLRNRLLKEQIDIEKQKKEEFVKITVNKQQSEDKNLKLHLTEKAQRVLIVDDEEIIREIIPTVLHQVNDNIEIETASDGLDALKKIENNRPSILITDIVMPNMSGIELLQELKKRNINIPILIISGYASSSSDYVMQEITGFGKKALFLSKPLGLKELITSINQLMDK